MKKTLHNPRFFSKIFLFISILALTFINLSAQDGILDVSFDSDGYVTTNVGAGDQATAIDVLPDDRIAVAGSAENSGDTNIIVTMYRPDGSQITSFGKTGFAEINITSDDDAYCIEHVLIDNKGTIDTLLFIGGETDDKGKKYMTIICLDMDGKPYNSFDSDGILVTMYEGRINDLAINPMLDPALIEIYAAGYNNKYWSVLKMNMSGSLTTAFGNNGIAYSDIGFDAASASSIIFRENGSADYLILAGHIDNAGLYLPFVANINATDGNPDKNFGNSGYCILNEKYNSNSWASSLALQNINSQTYYVIGGTVSNEYTVDKAEDFMLARITDAGALDVTFGDSKTPGCLFTDIKSGSIDIGNTVLVQEDDNIVITGTANGRYAIAKLLSDGSGKDVSFGSEGIVYGRRSGRTMHCRNITG